MYSNLFRLTVLTSFNSLTIRKELDFESEYLFRMCSVVTNLVTSLEFQPIRCATTLFQFGRTRNGYVATRNILLSSSAESSSTSGSVVAPERSGQIEAWAGRNVERTMNKPSVFPIVDLLDGACKHELFLGIYNFVFHILNYFFSTLFSHFPLIKISLVFYLCHYLLCQRGNNHFDIHFRPIGPVLFPSKDGKNAVREGRNGPRSVYFPPESASFPL